MRTPVARLARRGPSRSPLDRRAVVVDTFTRADSASALGTAETGQAWSAKFGTWGITSSRCVLATSSGSGDQRAIFDSSLKDFTLSVSMTLGGTTGVILRTDTNATNNRVITFIASGVLYLAKVVAGAYTEVANTAVTWVDGDMLSARCYGSSFQIFQNGVQRISGTIADLPNLTHQGVFVAHSASATTARWDHLKVSR